MNDLQLGKLCLVKQFFWFLYPTKEMAATCGVALEEMHRESGRVAERLSQKFKCNVCVVEENTYVVLLEVDDDYIKLLDSNGNIGWIGCCDFSKYFETSNEKKNNL